MCLDFTGMGMDTFVLETILGGVLDVLFEGVQEEEDDDSNGRLDGFRDEREAGVEVEVEVQVEVGFWAELECASEFKFEFEFAFRSMCAFGLVLVGEVKGGRTGGVEVSTCGCDCCCSCCG